MNITIDGKKLDVPEGQCVLESALKNGIYVPHLCHHPDLPENESCRLCIVEVEGQDGVVPSCSLIPKEGMVVRTKSDRISKLRSLALDLLLDGHPEDCSTCPKYGSCELQTLMQYLGGAGKKMRHRSRGFSVNEKNPLITYDMNRCILCGRCVRACADLRGVGVIDYQKKDMEVYIGTLHEKLLKDADCRFCQACAEVCPTGTIRDKLMTAKENAGRPKEDVIVPCRAACPAHTDVPRYIRKVKEGRYDEAAAVIRQAVPFPKTLGYICTHVCELDCKRKEINEAMSIREIKRYAAEHDTGSVWRGKGKQLPDTGKKVCVVGAGPCGMTAAYYLRKQGHEVTIKETYPEAGGQLRYGIPEYRLPRDIVDEEFSVITKAGVKTQFNTRVERPADLLQEYDAVLLALGTHKGVRLPMEGSSLPEVMINTDFLSKAACHEETGIFGKHLVVLGGGNVAFDCARTAKRLGAAEIHLACLEARAAMTADDEEIEQAREEGIFVHPAQTFERITGTDEGHVTGVDFMNVESFTFDENRRAIIRKEPGSEHHIACDTVIFATGQRTDLSPECGIEIGRANSVKADFTTKKTSIEGVYGAGDCIYGTKSVIMAIQSGREAASEIDRYLGGDGDISEKLLPDDEYNPEIGRAAGFGYEQRRGSRIDKAEARQDNFRLFDHGVCDGDICGETSRCLQCDLRLKITQPRLWGDYEGKEVKA